MCNPSSPDEFVKVVSLHVKTTAVLTSCISDIVYRILQTDKQEKLYLKYINYSLQQHVTGLPIFQHAKLKCNPLPFKIRRLFSTCPHTKNTVTGAATFGDVCSN